MKPTFPKERRTLKMLVPKMYFQKISENVAAFKAKTYQAKKLNMALSKKEAMREDRSVRRPNWAVPVCLRINRKIKISVYWLVK
jgi:hypothetical protein